jgi:small subunit ribosomal protein S29
MDAWLKEAKEEGKSQSKILTGEKGSGKSLLLLQTLALAFVNDWVVINIPEGEMTLCFHSPTPIL